jgi:hypothetical protein
VSIHADGGAELARVQTDANGTFEWRHPYAVEMYFVWPRARGVKDEITTWWPAAAFHQKKLYVPYRVRDAIWGEQLDIQVGECWSCGTCEECGRAYPFRVEEREGATYHVHYLDIPPEPVS